VTPEQAFDAMVRGDASRPFVTYYDEATGERTELSVKSLANWVAKTHHLLADELGVGVGDTALVSLPAHWLAYPVLLGCLTAGLALTPDDAAAADVAFVSPEALHRAEGVPDVYAIAPDSAAVGFRDEPPPGTADYVAAVRPQADTWPSVHLAAADDDPYTAELTRGAALREAADFAAEIGLADRGRLLATAATAISEAYWRHLLLLPLAVRGSVVLVRNSPTAEVLNRRASQERVDLVW
jgi:uncharacterized protein (TIGR03089 family)